MTNKFKELMSQFKDETAPVVTVEGKKKLAEHYKFNQGWYDALLNTDMVLNTHPEGQKLALKSEECRQIVEIGIYEGASTCFWSDFYLDHPESRLISIDPFTGSEEHHAEPEKYPELANLELIARGNIAKSKNAAKIEVLKGFSQFIYPELCLRHGADPWIDVLYVDGAHDPTSVARDTVLYVPMVKQGGLVIFDDYGHPDVKRGVDNALNSFASAESAIFTGWQLVVKM